MMSPVTEQTGWRVQSVDDYGRDPQLVAALSPLVRMRWKVTVTGAERLPIDTAALLVCNSRRFSLSAVYAALALSEATSRTVRFVGRPDTAPLGPLMRRVGALLAHPSDVLGALRDGELVLISAAGTTNSRHAGAIPHELLAQAVIADVPVLPVTTMSSLISRTARVSVGGAVPAEQVRRDLQRMLDSHGRS